jgi:hypothetical protein
MNCAYAPRVVKGGQIFNLIHLISAVLHLSFSEEDSVQSGVAW